jgi:hypothetical protein
MSYRSTVLLINLPNDGGEIHIYDTFDPAFTDGHTQQRRINVRLPRCEELPTGIDYDEPVTPESCGPLAHGVRI